MVGMGISSIAGLVATMLISKAFGTSAEIDAFYAANRVTEIIFNLMAGGALASAFIPTFTGLLTRGNRAGAWRLASQIANWVFITMTGAAVVSWVIAPWIVPNLLAPGFKDPAQIALTVNLLREMLLAPLIFGISGLLMGILNGQQHFVLPAIAPACYQLGLILGILVLVPLVNTIIASGQPEGSLAAITWGFKLMIMPQAVLAQAIAIAALPTFSEQVAFGAIGEMRASLAKTLRGILFLSLPASLGLILMRYPVVEMLMERGAFDANSTRQVAWALLWYAAGLVGHSLLEIIVRAFYALKDTFTPVKIGIIAMSFNVIFSLGFSMMFDKIGWQPHGGLALANSLATAFECTILLILLRRKMHGLDLHRLQKGVIASLGASLAMAGFLLAWSEMAAGQSIWLIGLGGVALGGGVYWAIALLLKAPEARELPRMVLVKLRR
jgi:putative peptidoglycan lipid II flippase